MPSSIIGCRSLPTEARIDSPSQMQGIVLSTVNNAVPPVNQLTKPWGVEETHSEDRIVAEGGGERASSHYASSLTTTRDTADGRQSHSFLTPRSWY